MTLIMLTLIMSTKKIKNYFPYLQFDLFAYIGLKNCLVIRTQFFFLFLFNKQILNTIFSI